MVGLTKKFNASTIAVISIILFCIILMIHIFIIHFGTEIGKDGYRDTFMKNLFYIVEGLLILIISLVSLKNFKLKLNTLIGAMIVSIVLIIFGIIGSYILLTESQDDIITEKLTNIRIERSGYHNQNMKIEGIVNEEKRYFILRGRDKALVKSIKDNGNNYIIIVYHYSSKRIESISFY